MQHAAPDTPRKGTIMELLTLIATHAIAFALLAGLALPVLAARLILAFETRPARLVLPSAVAAASRQAALPRKLRFRRLPTLALQYASPRARAGRSRTAPGLAARWKGAHRLAVSA
jgi:hypothetical protein